MNITHLTQAVTTSGGGISEVVRALAMAQQQAGDSPRVLSVQDDGEAIGPWPAGSPEFMSARHFSGMIMLPDLNDRLDGQAPEVLHTHGIWSYLSIGVPRWARKHECPYIVSPHGMLDSWALDHSKLKKKIAATLYERRHLRRAACLHALCRSEADSIRRFGLKNPIAVIPNGIEIPIPKIEEERYKIEDPDKKLLLFLGRLHPKKGLENALRAWAAIRHSPSAIRHQHDWQFVIAGWDQGGHEERLKALCAELGISIADIPAAEFMADKGNSDQSSKPSVVFTGPLFGELKAQLLERASVFILPSFSEGLPMSVLEAWANELPVIMTEHCNLPEGFSADAAIHIGTKVECIAAGMIKMIDSSEVELKAMGANGLNLVKEKFTWPTIAAQMKELYQWVLASGAKGQKPEFVE